MYIMKNGCLKENRRLFFDILSIRHIVRYICFIQVTGIRFLGGLYDKTIDRYINRQVIIWIFLTW